MNAPGPRCYAFGHFRLDPLRGRLTNGAAAIDLRPKSLAVLQYLVSHPHRLVGKDELLDAVWDKVVVTEDSLVQCVRDIRQALGDPDHQLVRTIPRSGYMFVAPVTEEPPLPFGEASSVPPIAPPFDSAPGPAPVVSGFDAAPTPAPVISGVDAAPGLASAAPEVVQQPAWRALGGVGNRWKLAVAFAVLVAIGLAWAFVTRDAADKQAAESRIGGGSRSFPPLSIVVLPLVNIDGDPAHEYFAQGLTNDLTTDLGRIPMSLVISHNTAQAYAGRQVDHRKVGSELGVRYALEGSVQRLDDSVRVNVRLIDTDRGAQRWAERFEGLRSELPQMQADIVRRIARTLEVQLLEAEADRSARERTQNPDAQDLLMRGWALWERRQPADNARARELFAQALIADPKFSLAWVGIANTHLSDLHAGWSKDRQASLQKADHATSRAYEIGPRHRDVNAGRGYVLFFQGNIEQALAAFDEEIETNAGNPLAHVWRGLMLISLGRAAEAIPSIERGIMLSPRDVDLNIFYRSLAHANFSVGRFDQAASWSQKAVGHTPTYAKGYGFLAAAAASKGDSVTASSALNTFRQLQPKYVSVAAFRQSMMPGELRMFDATPGFWQALAKAGLPTS